MLNIINNPENKSTGPHRIPIKLLKLIPDLIIVQLCKIICKTIEIHKWCFTVELNNYRQISLLSIFDEIIEKIMYKRLYNFLVEHNILFNNQFGFRKNNSTSLALIQITEKIEESIDNRKYGCGIFIDLSKAFNTVNHSILLRKLEHYGVRDIA